MRWGEVEVSVKSVVLVKEYLGTLQLMLVVLMVQQVV
jgi:hypothetical protein